MAEFVGLQNIDNESKRRQQNEAARADDTIDGHLKEFEALDSLLSQIPKKAQHGLLMSCDLVLTCIDANKSFIALGTNVGLTFLYSRKDSSVQRLKSENASEVITSVRLHHGIDDQLATGTASGEITVFCLPGPSSVQKKQLQKFVVKDLHRYYVTCLEWSTNGMKLYSGDKKGQVAVTEVDFYEGQCKSSLLLVESNSEIIQLDYKHKVLLVSTRHRCFVVRLDRSSELVNIGTQDRKMTGPFGACFVPGLCKTDDAKLYAARSGCRLWLSDIQGVVKNTHIFSDPLASNVPEIPLLSAGKIQMNQQEFQFGRLKWFREKEIVTWSNSALVVLDPLANHVVARQGRLSGIVDVAVVEDSAEIFLLRRHATARVIRIADKPEIKTIRAEVILPSLPPVIVQEKKPDITEQVKESSASLFFKKFTNPLKKFEKHVENKEAPPPVVPSPDTSPELPPVVRLASPELDGVRVFTGDPAGPSATEVPAQTDTSTSDLNTSGLEADKNSKVAESNTQNIDPQVLNTGESLGHSFLGEEPVPAPAATNDSIVFSHRMRKPKKKRHKGGSLQPAEGDGDNISQLSGSSQLSDELNKSHSQQPTNHTPKQDSPQEAIKRADEVLKLVDSVLHGDRISSSEVVKKTAIGKSQNDEAVDLSSVTQKNSVLLLEQSEKENQRNMPKSTHQEEKIKSFLLPEEASSQTSVKEEKKGVSKRESTRTSSLSESDQHISMSSPELSVSNAEIHDTVDSSRSDIDILNSAMAKLDSLDSASNEPKANKTENMVQNNEPTPGQKRQKIISQDSFQDIYGEIEAIESTDPFRKGYKKEKSADDFYSIFLDTSPESPEYPASNHERSSMQRIPSEIEQSTMQDISQRRMANSWSEFSTPANMYSLAVTNTHVWFTDKSENIHYSSIGSPKGILWRKASGQASQISISPSGHIVWRLHRGVVFAGTKISSRHPEGLKWVEAVRDVLTIAVDNNCAWYVKRNGEVMVQRGLSQERPCYKSKKVECSYRLQQLSCRNGVVWAITENLQLLVRTGVSSERPEGDDWELDVRETSPFLFSNVAIDNENVGWAIDVLGQIWVCDGVSKEQPKGNGLWWQVPLSEYILQDETTMDMIKAAARRFDPKNLPYILSTKRGGLISVGSQGVWLAPDFRNILLVCRGSVQGYHWLQAHPAQMSPSSSWKIVCATISDLDWGLVWAQHTNGDVYTFKRAYGDAAMIPDVSEFCCISVGPTAVWALTLEGEIKVRAGMGPHCPQGSAWVNLDLAQLGDAHIVHLSCNSFYVWAVESEGVVYQRIGAKPPSDATLSAVWLPIETFAGIVFTKVFTGPLHWMVWAVDNRRLTYVRVGVTEEMPIGQEWVHVPGIQAMDLAVTKTGVWALTPNGEIFFRYGIGMERPCGNYWKKIPGMFTRISASAKDDLWGINTEGQLMQCSFKYLKREQDDSDPLLQRTISTASSVSEETDWEIV